MGEEQDPPDREPAHGSAGSRLRKKSLWARKQNLERRISTQVCETGPLDMLCHVKACRVRCKAISEP